MSNSIGIPKFILGLEWLYLLVWAELGVLAIWLLPNWKSNLGATLLVVITGGALPVYLSLQIKQEVANKISSWINATSALVPAAASPPATSSSSTSAAPSWGAS